MFQETIVQSGIFQETIVQSGIFQETIVQSGIFQETMTHPNQNQSEIEIRVSWEEFLKQLNKCFPKI